MICCSSGPSVEWSSPSALWLSARVETRSLAALQWCNQAGGAVLISLCFPLIGAVIGWGCAFYTSNQNLILIAWWGVQTKPLLCESHTKAAVVISSGGLLSAVKHFSGLNIKSRRQGGAGPSVFSPLITVFTLKNMTCFYRASLRNTRQQVWFLPVLVYLFVSKIKLKLMNESFFLSLFWLARGDSFFGWKSVPWLLHTKRNKNPYFSWLVTLEKIISRSILCRLF